MSDELIKQSLHLDLALCRATDPSKAKISRIRMLIYLIRRKFRFFAHFSICIEGKDYWLKLFNLAEIFWLGKSWSLTDLREFELTICWKKYSKLSKKYSDWLGINTRSNQCQNQRIEFFIYSKWYTILKDCNHVPQRIGFLRRGLWHKLNFKYFSYF